MAEKGTSRARQAAAPRYKPRRPSDLTICAALRRAAPVTLAFSPCICRRILTISSGFVKTCGRVRRGQLDA